MEEKSHLHWSFIAYKKLEDKKFIGVTAIDVVGYKDEKKALMATRVILNRPYYHLARVWECKSCGIAEKQANLLGEMVKELKGKGEFHK